MQWRGEVRESDRQSVRQLVAATGFFSPEEQDVAVELVDEALREGSASGYEFIFADDPESQSGVLGYACFGPIAERPGHYDLYWIAVAPSRQRLGLGRALIAEAERRCAARGASDVFVDTSGRAQYAPTRSFYERMGYIVHELVPGFYAPGDAKVVYRKKLDTQGTAPHSPPLAHGTR